MHRRLVTIKSRCCVFVHFSWLLFDSRVPWHPYSSIYLCWPAASHWQVLNGQVGSGNELEIITGIGSVLFANLHTCRTPVAVGVVCTTAGYWSKKWGSHSWIWWRALIRWWSFLGVFRFSTFGTIFNEGIFITALILYSVCSGFTRR